MRDISNVKQEIINFRKVIRPPGVPSCATSSGSRHTSPDMDLEIYFDDIVDIANERIWDMLENDKEVVEALEDWRTSR